MQITPPKEQFYFVTNKPIKDLVEFRGNILVDKIVERDVKMMRRIETTDAVVVPTVIRRHIDKWTSQKKHFRICTVVCQCTHHSHSDVWIERLKIWIAHTVSSLRFCCVLIFYSDFRCVTIYTIYRILFDEICKKNWNYRIEPESVWKMLNEKPDQVCCSPHWIWQNARERCSDDQLKVIQNRIAKLIGI